ncbi:MAG: DUF1273 family protein [Clostridia bacterium]|nr:DUF1273 family protein [Clostridia bacterium]
MQDVKICCFTGHRTIEAHHVKQLPELLQRTLDDLVEEGYEVFRAGGAIGFDTLAALKVLEQKKSHPHIRLELILPCRDQTARWGEYHRSVYDYILTQADRIVYTSERYTPGCMAQRNRMLVNGSLCCVAFCSKQSGGSAYTLQYAHRKGLRTINLYDEVL